MKKSKFLLLIISLIFLLNIFLFNSFATLYIIKDPEGDFALITNLENIMLKYQLLDYKISIVKESSQKPSAKSQSSPKPKPKTEPIAKIKIVDWTKRISGGGNYYIVDGILKNISNITVKFLKVKVITFDSKDNLVSIEEVYADPSTLKANQEATFTAMPTYTPEIKSFEFAILWK
ncbi:hypothetical protein ES708_08239 [subsurface metagenome]